MNPPTPAQNGNPDDSARRQRTEEELKAVVSQLTATLDPDDFIAVVVCDNRRCYTTIAFRFVADSARRLD